MKIFIHRKNRLLCLFLFAFCSCGKNAAVRPSAPNDTSKTVAPVTVNFPVPNYNPSALDTSAVFLKQPQVSVLARQDLPEISGIAASKLNPGILYIHNDSGNPSQIYLTDAAGRDRGSFSLNVANRDWEDIAVGPGPIAGKSYIYLADIGDNDAKYSSVFVYRFPEPTIGADNNVVPVDPTSVEKIELKYPDGPRNAETILVDPLTKDIFIASKQSNFSQVYRAAYPQSTTTVTTMQPIVRIYINKATGGSVSADGTEVLIRDNQSIWYWKAQNGQSISDLLKNQPQIAPYANNEPQGEGVGFAIDGSGYFTDTEIKGYAGKQATVSFYGRK